MAAPVVDLIGRWGGKLRTQDLDVMSGDDLTLQITTLETDNTAKDMTGGAVSWVLSLRPGCDAKLTIAGSLTDPANGISQVALTGTHDLDGPFYHEAQFTESGGAIGTIMRGWMMINRDSA